MKKIGRIGDPVIIKENGTIEHIKESWGKLIISLSIDLPEEMNPQEGKFTHKSDDKKIGWWYTLKNGADYHEDELIIGTEEIRDFKINQIDGIQ
jgi:hypothetical protein